LRSIRGALKQTQVALAARVAQLRTASRTRATARFRRRSHAAGKERRIMFDFFGLLMSMVESAAAEQPIIIILD
jgi:hypothetical protein